MEVCDAGKSVSRRSVAVDGHNALRSGEWTERRSTMGASLHSTQRRSRNNDGQDVAAKQVAPGTRRACWQEDDERQPATEAWTERRTTAPPPGRRKSKEYVSGAAPPLTISVGAPIDSNAFPSFKLASPSSRQEQRRQLHQQGSPTTTTTPRLNRKSVGPSLTSAPPAVHISSPGTSKHGNDPSSALPTGTTWLPVRFFHSLWNRLKRRRNPPPIIPIPAAMPPPLPAKDRHSMTAVESLPPPAKLHRGSPELSPHASAAVHHPHGIPSAVAPGHSLQKPVADPICTTAQSHLASSPGTSNNRPMVSVDWKPPVVSPFGSNGASSSGKSWSSPPAKCNPNSLHPTANPPPLTVSTSGKLTLAERTLAHHTFQRAFLEKYRITEVLGEGGFGFVAAAVLQQSPDNGGDTRKEEVAVKFILKEKIPVTSYIKDPELHASVPFEIYALRRAKHPNIIRFLDWYEDALFFYLVTELHGDEWMPTNAAMAAVPRAPGTPRASMDLFECIDVHERLEETLARMVFRQVMDAISYLHESLGICHRDIKDENVVVDRRFRVKLIDFGAAAVIPKDTAETPGRLYTAFHGTLQYCPPEILRGAKYRGPEAEVWGLGVLLYTMVFGENPFNDPKNIVTESVSIERLAATCGCLVYVGGKLITDLRTLKLSSPSSGKGGSKVAKIYVSHGCMDLLVRMLDRNPCTRITVQELVRHPWLTEEH